MVQNLIRGEFKKAFENFDLLISPTAPSTAFKLGEKVSDPLSMYLSDICTIGLNLAELPGMSLPSGFDKTGLPIGLQLIANSFKEDQIFKAGFSLERLLGLTQRKPAFYV